MNTPAPVSDRPEHNKVMRPAGFGNARVRPPKRDSDVVKQQKQEAKDKAREKRDRMLKDLDKANGYSATWGPKTANGYCPARAIAADKVGVRYRPVYAPRSKRHINDVVELTEKIDNGKPQSALLRSRVDNVPVSFELDGEADDRRAAQAF